MNTRDCTELAIGFKRMDLDLDLDGRGTDWDAVRANILGPALRYFEAQHGEQFSSAHLIRKMALYYLDHADRYGLDEEGYPRIEEGRAAKAAADMLATLKHFHQAAGRHLETWFDEAGKQCLAPKKEW